MSDPGFSLMKNGGSRVPPEFVVATPQRSVCDDSARALEHVRRLRFLALGTLRGAEGVPRERTRLAPWFGLLNFAGCATLSTYRAESLRFAMHPLFDRWVRSQMIPGDHIISSYGHANASFAFARQHGGRTFLDGGNSHPENLWSILSEEHRRWNCPYPPFAEHHYRRSLAMLPHVDYVLSPSSFVTRSFLDRGFKPGQILRNVYPLDLSCFTPAQAPRPATRPLTLISTGALSLRKGTPYLLEAFRLLRLRHPSARLLLTEGIRDDVRPCMARYRDLPVEWSPSLPHPRLAERLRGADMFLLPSLEDGFARTVAEALACGLPVITTPNTGACDLVQPGRNGEIVPIRDPQAIADAVVKWAEIVLKSDWRPRPLVDPALISAGHFEREFIGQLRTLQLV